MLTKRLQRCWINQPSTLQPLHHLHGTNVLAGHDRDDTWVVYFLSGDTISMEVFEDALSPGWKCGSVEGSVAVEVVK